MPLIDAKREIRCQALINSMAWKYQPVLNACIQILVTVALGTVMAAFKVFENAFVPQAVKFVFYVALPCLVISGLGIHIDFSSDSFIWDYIFAYLELRAIALGAALVVVLVRYRREISWDTLGHMTVKTLPPTAKTCSYSSILPGLYPRSVCIILYLLKFPLVFFSTARWLGLFRHLPEGSGCMAFIHLDFYSHFGNTNNDGSVGIFIQRKILWALGGNK